MRVEQIEKGFVVCSNENGDVYSYKETDFPDVHIGDEIFPMKVACMFSGGLDSTILLKQLIKTHGKKNIVPIFFKYGQRNLHAEEETVQQFCRTWDVTGPEEIDVSDVFSAVPITPDGNIHAVDKGEHNSRSMINRNLVFIASATSRAITLGCKKLYSGSCLDDRDAVADGTPEFYAKVKDILKFQFPDFDVEMPFMSMTKDEEVQLGIQLGMTEDDFNNTISCYEPYKDNGKWIPCEKCHGCLSSIVPLRKQFGPPSRLS